MDIYVAGKGKVTLSDSKDFIAQGGQGKIYAKSGTVYKIYENRADMIPSAKIQELSVLGKNPCIIAPEKIILDAKNHEIGYTMPHVEGVYALCELFPQAFWDRNKFDHPKAIKLITGMQDTINEIHNHDILIVDLNEMNFLVKDHFGLVFFIDVDNYQTRNFFCTAIMPNIRDWSAKQWSKESDWYSFGIVTFNMLVGIHPFKGRHPDFKWPINEATLTARMQQNVSIFDPKVQLPGVCRPLTAIPKNYFDWYRSMFVDGNRQAPPSTMTPVVAPTIRVHRISGTDNFDIAEIMELPENIVAFHNFGGTEVTATTSSLYSGKRKVSPFDPSTEIGITPKTRYIVTGAVENGKLKLHNATSDSPIQCDVLAEDIMGYDGRLYFKKLGKVMQIEFSENGINVIPYYSVVAQCHEKAAKMYDGVIVQPLFGKTFATIFPKTGESVDVSLDFVDGQIIAAKYDNRVLMLVSNKGGKYSRHVLRFNALYAHDHKAVHDVAYTGLNFVTLDNGVCCNMNEADEIELFRNIKNDPMVKVVPDSHIDASMRLFKNGTQVIFAKVNRLYTMKLKK